MKHTVLKSLAAVSVLALGVAACGGSSAPKKAATTTTGQPLVVESTPLSPMTDTFNPFSSTSTGFITNSVALYNEPLYIWNNMKPTQAPIPVLASGQPTWSNGGKSLTIPVRPGVKFSDGKPFSASDVAFTFNMLKTHPSLFTSGAPAVTSATASSATSVTLNFSQPEYANLFLIGQVYIVPQHVWSSVGNPATFADPKPVGTGPFMLDKFSPQGYTMKLNPLFRAKSSVRVPEIDFPAYNTNANLVPPLASGQIDWAGNFVSDIKGNYLSKSPDNRTWLNQEPYFASNNVVTLMLNATQAALARYASSGDPSVQNAAIAKLGQIMTSQVPVVPLLYGGAWSQTSTRHYTGWPTASNPYMVPVPNTPYLEYTIFQLKPKS